MITCAPCRAPARCGAGGQRLRLARLRSHQRHRRPARRDAAPVVALGGPALDIGSGGSHSCAIMAQGQLRCWGTTRPASSATVTPITSAISLARCRRPWSTSAAPSLRSAPAI
ncbi:hypothetical protein [Nannocystis pusilla]|uniref:hypothetical protein n=1 Tax=Nannocystis pusilla TaxID=889268 RepID=UPI003B7FCA20